MYQTLLLGCSLFAAVALAQDKPPDTIPARFGIDADIDGFPQTTPKDALRSVVKAMDARRINYLLAHLAEPTWTDKRVKDLGGKFEDAVKEVTDKLTADGETLTGLRKILSDGDWNVDDTTANARHKDVKGRVVSFKKIGARWYMENRTKEKSEK